LPATLIDLHTEGGKSMSSEQDLDAARKLAMAQLSDEERAALEEDELSPDERAALTAIAGDEGEGADEDDEDDDSEDDDEDGEDDTKAADKAGKLDVKAAAADTLEGDDADDDAPPPFKPHFKVEVPADLDEQLAALATKEAELAEQMKAGEIDMTEFLAQQRTVAKEIAKLESTRERAATFEEINAQSATQEWNWTVAQFLRKVKKNEGIDYAPDSVMGGDFDTFVKAVAARPENADKDFAFFLTEAHKRVKALHGIADKTVKPEAKPKPGDKPAARKPGVKNLPADLAHVPGGDGPGDVGDDEYAALDKLEGLEYETALAAMPKAARERYLQAA
jgi:hypothetical protein